MQDLETKKKTEIGLIANGLYTLPVRVAVALIFL